MSTYFKGLFGGFRYQVSSSLLSTEVPEGKANEHISRLYMYCRLCKDTRVLNRVWHHRDASMWKRYAALLMALFHRSMEGCVSGQKQNRKCQPQTISQSLISLQQQRGTSRLPPLAQMAITTTVSVSNNSKLFFTSFFFSNRACRGLCKTSW